MKANARFINTEKIEGYVYSTGSNFNQLSERVTGENSKNPGTKYIAGDLDVAVDDTGLNVITIHYTYVTETYIAVRIMHLKFSVLELLLHLTTLSQVMVLRLRRLEMRMVFVLS